MSHLNEGICFNKNYNVWIWCFICCRESFLKDSQSTFYVSSTVTVVIQHFKLNEVSKILSPVFIAIYPDGQKSPADIGADNDIKIYLSEVQTLTISDT